MSPSDWSDLIALLEGAKRGLHFGEGLSDAEVQRTEESYGVRFPPDLRAFLQTALPLGSPFPNWRTADDPIAKEAEICFTRHSFRCREWRLASGVGSTATATGRCQSACSSACREGSPAYTNLRPSHDARPASAERQPHFFDSSNRHDLLWLRSGRLLSPRV